MPHPGQIKKAAKAILSSERPVIYSGGGVIIGNASKELNEVDVLSGNIQKLDVKLDLLFQKEELLKKGI